MSSRSVRLGLLVLTLLTGLSGLPGPTATASAGPVPAAPSPSAEERRLDGAVPREILRRSGFDEVAPRFTRQLERARSRAEAGSLDAAYREIEELAAHQRIRVVGETGLDYFRTGPNGVGVQQDSFRWHIDLAKRLGKALQIHDRDAHDDVLRILGEEGAPDRTVMHCFSGDVGIARQCVERGYFLSFAGTVTFKNARSLRDALAVTPLEQVLVETDAPYLTPAPWRGATNAPYLVPLTVRVMAGVMGVAVPTLCQALSANSERVYGAW